jgi:hypothetical protein
MLTGRLPFDADTPIAVVLKHITAPLPSARAFVPDLPESIEAVLSTAMAKSPGERFASAGELAAAFDSATHAGLQPETKPMEPSLPPTLQADSMRPTVAPRKPIRIPRPSRSVVAVIAVSIALVGLLAVTIGNRPPERDPSVVVTAGPNIITVTPSARSASPNAPTPTLEPVAALCEPILSDDFSNVASGFPRGENDTAAWNYADGEYRIGLKAANVFEARTLRQQVTDYSVEADARFASDTPGHYGLVLSADASGTSYYSFAVDGARNFAVTLRTPGGSTLIRDWTFAPSLNVGGEVNRLLAVHKNGAIAVFANDVLLAVVSDTLKLPASRIGFIAASLGSGNVDARFDNFRVCRAPESLSPETVSLVDAFEDDRNRWGAVRYPGDLSAFIEDGQFQLNVPFQDPRYALFHWNPNFAVGDFDLEVDSRVLEGASGSRAGVMFGVQDLGSNYIVYASNDGRLTLFNRVDGSQLALSEQVVSTLQPGDAINHWRIVVADGAIGVWLNGEQALQASIAYTPGAIGFACEPAAAPIARCAFDNLTVRGKPSTAEAVAYPFCNCLLTVRAGQPVRIAFAWPAAESVLVDRFLSAISMTVTIDGKPLDNPLQYWGQVESGVDGPQSRWRYPLPPLELGSHTIEVSITSDVELTDGHDANGDGRPDTFGPGELLTGYVQVVVIP